ncbi:type 1 periplasmic binding fold superfamily protein [Flavivirga jejuensis]|uniref:Type 1 periplasmic binding fold superfamily protein n=1 Tax=Flavivirga jejuensis TaxID=870487 RepID=A0ABT8WPN3_9FLAO|nr:type 1 periplasmic binding fold superfamily protein [Flavivirga jejuensis]MDO5974949.1 type 1 periplasmic binding fold superfamily protein [Flavivirga jejuensis]
MKILKKITILLFISALIFNSCSSNDDNPELVIEEEVITTVTVTLTPEAGGTDIVLESVDLDGDGPDAPVVSVSGNLDANTTYNGSIVLLNETESPAENITEEIEELDEEHQFFYSTTSGIATFEYNDTDANGNPIGLDFLLTTSTSAASGTITIILRHLPNKDGENVSDGDITNAGGETDVSVTFSVSVQ